jgi:MOSC domain-containing protein YiiM
MPTITIRSINIGRVEPLMPLGTDSATQKRTGIQKRPVATPVALGPLGLDGDHVGDTRHHGGHDQAVYLYSADDYAWWSEQLGHTLAPGTFGENLTIDAWWPDPRVGDRVVIGEVTLELTAPRIPCATLAARMNDPRFVKTFTEAARSGAYARVITTGSLHAGDTGTVQHGDAAHVTIAEMFSLWYRTPRDTPEVREALRTALRAPIASRSRLALAGWLGED